MSLRTLQYLWFIATLPLLLSGGLASAQTKAPTTPNELAKSRNQLIEATREYKANTEQLGRLQEEELTRATARVDELRQLVAEGIVAKAELEEGEQSLAALQAKLSTTRQQIAAGDQMIAEIQAAEELARTQSPALLARPVLGKSGGYAEHPQSGRGPASALVTPTILRYRGAASWSLTHLSNIQVFFTTRFGRTLPISAIGQSAAHNQLGYDHRNAIDVALHPDSVEGQTLMNYLRSQGNVARKAKNFI